MINSLCYDDWDMVPFLQRTLLQCCRKMLIKLKVGHLFYIHLPSAPE